SVGDGSNDIPMFKLCNEAGGLSIAFHAKPAVQAIAQISIMEGGMERILEVLPVKNIHPSSTKAVAPSAGAAQ
ncbi:MAG: hypothetical protein QM520_06230, partial [Gammaproteobacteria bacterium]|nr:hypothetical protein [Gammaproteobacteria bacterium]